MEKVELDKFWRKSKSDHSDYNQYQINNLMAFVVQENLNIQEVCETYKGLDLKFLKGKLKSRKPFVIGAGRPKLLSEEAKTHIRSLINVWKPETKTEIVRQAQEWLREKQVALKLQDKDDMSNTVSDRTIIRFLNAEMIERGAGGSRGVIPDSNTACRDRETKDPRNVLSWAAVVNAYCKDLYPQLVFNLDAVSLRYGKMMDGNDTERVMVYLDDLNELKSKGMSLKAQKEKEGDEEEKGVFCKKYHMSNSFGQMSPNAYMIEDDTIGPDECHWYKVDGLSSDNSVGGYGFIAFCKNRSGNDKFFELYIDNVILPFVTECRAQVEACTQKV